MSPLEDFTTKELQNELTLRKIKSLQEYLKNKKERYQIILSNIDVLISLCQQKDVLKELGKIKNYHYNDDTDIHFSIVTESIHDIADQIKDLENSLH